MVFSGPAGVGRHDLMLQSESMVAQDNQIERNLTITLLFRQPGGENTVM